MLRAIGQFTHPAPEGLVAHQHADERLGRLPSAGVVMALRAISSRASCRRWAGVRVRWPVVMASPCSARAAAQGVFSQVAAR